MLLNSDRHTAVIFASRPVSAGMRHYLPEDVFVITADAGWKNAAALGLGIDLAVGDFDSAGPPPAAGQQICLPTEKDDTDTHFAARQALRLGFSQVILLGALGGRPDHTHANLQTMLFLAKNGVDVLAADDGCALRCFGPGLHTVRGDEGPWLSVFAAEGEADGVYLTGVKYPLHNAHLTADMPLGVSNEFLAPAAGIACEKGWLYVYVSREV